MTIPDITQFKKGLTYDHTIFDQNLTFHTTWGIFSPKKIDEGSELLIRTLLPEMHENDRLLDIGCGYGAIGLYCAQKQPTAKIHMIDTNTVALEMARKNAEVNKIENVHIYTSNMLQEVKEDQFTKIVTNIPAKVGNELYWILVTDAYDALALDGELYVVCVAGLKKFFKRIFKEVFGNYEYVSQHGTYTVVKAVK